MKRTILFLAIFFSNFVVATRNAIIFNNCFKRVCIKYALKKSSSRKKNEERFLEVGEAVFVKDFKENKLSYCIAGGFVQEYLKSYKEYDFGDDKIGTNVCVVLYQTVQKHKRLSYYSPKRDIHSYDLFSEGAFDGSRIKRYLLGFSEAEEYTCKALMRLEKGSKFKKEQLEEYIAIANKGIEEYIKEQEDILEFGEEKLSRQIYDQVKELELRSRDYFSSNGKKVGRVGDEFKNYELHEKIRKHLSDLEGEYRKLLFKAQQKAKFLKKKKGKNKEEVEEEENEDDKSFMN